MNWNDQYNQYYSAKTTGSNNEQHLNTEKVLRDCRAHLPKKNSPEWQWFIDALEDNEKKWFVVKVIDKLNPLPKKLFSPLLKAAIYEKCVSYNKFFLFPVCKYLNHEKILIEVLSYLDIGNIESSRGVGPILYWLSPSEELCIIHKVQFQLMKTFIEIDDLKFRQHTLPSLSFNSEYKDLQNEIINICRNSHDEYLAPTE